MRNTDRRRYEMLTRVRTFGASHARHFPGTSTAHSALTVIAAEIAQLERLDVAERSASQAARAARNTAARKTLIDCLARADNTARVLARTHPQLAADGKLPSPVDDVALLTIARDFAIKAAPLAAEFAAHGIPISELEDRIGEFDGARNERGMQRDEKVRARTHMEASFQRGLDAVACVGVNVANYLAGDAAATAVWKGARRLWDRRRVRDAADGADAAAPDSSAAPAPPATEAA